MWWEIIPSFVIIGSLMAIPTFGIYHMNKAVLGNANRRDMRFRWDRTMYERDRRLTGNPYQSPCGLPYTVTEETVYLIILNLELKHLVNKGKPDAMELCVHFSPSFYLIEDVDFFFYSIKRTPKFGNGERFSVEEDKTSGISTAECLIN